MDPIFLLKPHRRFNPLTGEWVLVSPNRTNRPWNGKVEDTPQKTRLAYDPKCYLCPGNPRAEGGKVNPAYTSTYAFENDFQALLPDTPSVSHDEDRLFVAETEPGMCRVICFSPRHDLSLARMDVSAIRGVVDVWIEQYVELREKPFVNYVQIFENRGEIMGCSNLHPHGQIWCSKALPTLPAMEEEHQRAYFASHSSVLLEDYVAQELHRQERIVFENANFVVLVPFWAIWPFETMILPKRSRPDISELGPPERDDLADAVRRLGVRYDNLFNTDFPYSMGIHQQPTDGVHRAHWHWHIHYFPPLLRSATVKKFMVGYEMLAMPQRDITPEKAATRLRESSDFHYSMAKGNPSRFE